MRCDEVVAKFWGGGRGCGSRFAPRRDPRRCLVTGCDVGEGRKRQGCGVLGDYRITPDGPFRDP